MKEIANEKNKLPLTFKYIDLLDNKNSITSMSSLVFFVECEKYKTEYLVRAKPYKSITRLL